MRALLFFLVLGVCASGTLARRRRQGNMESMLSLDKGGQPLKRANLTDMERKGKLFSLFNVVTFENEQCMTASSDSMYGTCMTSSECSNQGGGADGNCAAGFGVCCVFTVSTCGSNVAKNCTYIQNPEYPNSASASSTCKYNFNRIDDYLCQIRLDFDNLVMAQPPTAGVNEAGNCATSGDFLTVTTPTGGSLPVTCGTLTGMHMFLETGDSGSAGSAEFTYGAAASTRTYKIKVTYYACNSRNRAPEDCLQYFTGISNTFQSYNYPTQYLDGQNYINCFRQEEGFCSVEIRETITAGNTGFSLYGVAANTANPGVAETDGCTNTFVQIPQAQSTTSTVSQSNFCGGVLSTIDEDTTPGVITIGTAPFRVRTFAEDNMLGMANGAAITGYSLEYTQQPCA